MKTLVIISNNGNHEGVNRKWEIIAECATKKEAKEELISQSFEVNDNFIERNGRCWDPFNKEYVCVNGQKSFCDGLTTYTLLTREDVYNGFFNGGGNGYINGAIQEALNIDANF